MQYFDTLPKIIKTQDGTSIVLVDLMARVSVIPELLKDPVLYYSYDIQEGDTPEIIAHKYYGDSYRYWIVLFANQILDPQWSWPLDGNSFKRYLEDKYPSTNTSAVVKYYQKIISQYDADSQTTTTNTVNITQTVYNSLPTTSTKTVNLPTGQVAVTVVKNLLTLYDYEMELNEAKRNIRILNSLYVDQLETQLKNLMAK